MPTFGIVSEGITDQIVIQNLLVGFFDDSDIELNELQPLRDETDENKQLNPGNWLKVLEYCKSDIFRKAFEYLDYIIIHIDTDTCEEPGYDISRLENGRVIEAKEMIEKVKLLLISKIGINFYNDHKDQIIFAISVESIECWLLPFYCSQQAHKIKTVNCLNSLNAKMNTIFNFTIVKRSNYSQISYYEKASKILKKKKELMAHYMHNPSLDAFITSLTSRFQS